MRESQYDYCIVSQEDSDVKCGGRAVGRACSKEKEDSLAKLTFRFLDR